jgi:hypothetical protein
VAIAHQLLIDPTKTVRHMAQPLRTKYPFGFHRANASLLLVAGPPHFQGALGAQPGEVSFHFSERLGSDRQAPVRFAQR